MTTKAKYKKTKIGDIPVDWEAVALNESIVMMTNGFVGTATPFYTDASIGVTYLQGYNVRDNKIDLTGVTHVTTEFHEKQKKSKLKEGDMLTVQSGHIGTTAIVPYSLKGCNCHALIITRLDKQNVYPNFLAYYFNSSIGRSRLSGIMVGSTILHINVKDFKKIKLPLPPLPEQKKIAEILSTVDEHIEATDAIITETEQLKKGLMQKLFSEGIGHTRFKDTKIGRIPEEWEVVKLKKVCEILYGKDQKKVVAIEGDFPIFGTGGLMGMSSQFLYNKPSVLIGRKGTINKPQYIETPFWTVDTLYYTKVFNNLIPKLLYYYLNSIQLSRYNEATGVPSLNRDVLYNILIPLAPLPEQKQITSILTEVDNKLEQERSTKAELDELKRGLMQILLTGKVRVKVK
ncbi:restriction endonuclease subunit S [Bacteroidota bacterium]